ncbi:hypothetical protein C8R44DRAFT_741276 [Mycena epipterygia]|nr:hypothetical protein C8R44DRAFT_741276 [Mycena epipterygia]
MRMRPSLAILYVALLSLVGLAGAVLTNHTMDDTNPLVVYVDQKSPSICSGTTDGISPQPATIVDACSESPGDLSHMINQTLTLVSSGHIIIPFIGTALYVFFATGPGLTSMSLTYQLDGEVVGQFNTSTSDITSPDDVSTLGYQNTSMSNELHSFVIIPSPAFPQFLFDGAIYFSDDKAMPVGPSSSFFTVSPTRTSSSAAATTAPASSEKSGTLSTSTTSASSPAVTQSIQSATRVSSQKKGRAAAIAGGVVGALVVLVVALLIARLFLRRRGRRHNGASQDNLLTDEENTSSGSTGQLPAGAGTGVTGSSTSEDAAPAVKVRVLQAQPQVALHADDNVCETGNTSTPVTSDSRSVEAAASATQGPLPAIKRDQVAAVREEAAPRYRDSPPALWGLLVHTDSGLRLDPRHASVILEELPPVYVEE